MNTRLALYDLARQHGLAAEAAQSLLGSGGLNDEPAALQRWFWRAVAILAASLVGLGIILWLAANWETLGRMGRFALLQATILLACIGAAWQPRLRMPLGLLALFGIGGLLSYFGLTYQTGADPWQLFVLWAVLALPLCMGTRSDVLWAPWALVAMTGLSLWVHAHTAHTWRVERQDLGTFALAWGAAALLVLALSSALARWTGAGIWAMRTAATLGVITVTLSAVWSLFSKDIAPQFTLAIVLFTAAAVLLSQRRCFDVFVLSAVGLGLNTILVGGLARLLLEGGGSDPILKLLLLGAVAAALLAASVSAITRLAARFSEPAP